MKPSSLHRYPRGSEWRRWDLHVHTPFSILNNGFGGDFERYAKTLFERAVERDIAVIGVTDYFTVEGFRKLRDLQRDSAQLIKLLGEEVAGAARQILLLPNIELRLSDVIKVGQQEPRVNLHVIFAEDCSPNDIENQFLRSLSFLSESAPDALDERLPLTEENLRKLGRRLKEEHPEFAESSDLRVGMEQAVVSHQDVTETLSRVKEFTNRHLLVLSADEPLSRINWAGQGHLSRKAPIQKSHMLFSGNPQTRKFGLGEKHGSQKEFIEEFKTLKPCIHGSDAHRLEDLFVFAKERQLWIRADPSFNGLAQLLLAPAERVYIGPEPPALRRMREAAPKIIDQVVFNRVGDPDPSARWFSGSIPLNPGLVAVIGKKGNGKSGLAEAIALAGNARNSAYFSFLSKDRFLTRPERFGDYFSVEVNWRAGESVRKLLSESADHSVPGRVKYVPQHYLEEVCTEITDSSARTLFDDELEAVIFSHVREADRLGQESLQALVEHKTAAVEGRIEQLRSRLTELNRSYFGLRRRGSQENRRTLIALLAEKKAELDAHEETKPVEVAKPDEQVADSAATAAASDLIQVVNRIEDLDRVLAELKKREEEEKQRLAAFTRVSGRIENLRGAVTNFYEDSAADFELLGYDAHQIVSLGVEDAFLEKSRTRTEQEIDAVGDALDEDHSESPAHARVQASVEADQLRHRLSEPQRRYQEYERALAQWQRRCAKIRGSADKPNSVAGLEAKLAGLDAVPEEIAAVEKARNELMTEIFAAKGELLDEYRRLYMPVQDVIDNHPVAEEVTALSFSAENTLDGLTDTLLSMIHHGRRGSFQGEQEGRELLEELIEEHEFSTAAGVEDFLDDLINALTHDIRRDDRPKVEIESQLVSTASAEALYDFIFGLGYMQPRFELRWSDKPLHQLSPGERGTLLLIFYLLIDTDNAPLLIDQPEENLDNETVTQLLVPAIKHAKDRRQIIMVTHNPNLAVVCDADQVIHASIDKANGNAITYTAGAIEDPHMNQLLIDVLEGTKPAFDLRDKKYDVLDRVAA